MIVMDDDPVVDDAAHLILGDSHLAELLASGQFPEERIDEFIDLNVG